MGQPRHLFIYFRWFQTHILQKKLYVVYSGIRTGIVGVEGEHADHLTTTTSLESLSFPLQIVVQQKLLLDLDDSAETINIK